MRAAAIAVLAVLVAGCGARARARGDTIALRAACPDGARWDGAACAPIAADAVAAVAANDARVQDDPAAALDAADAAAARGPFDRATLSRLWRQRGMAHALLAHAAAAEAKDDPSVADARRRDQQAHERAARAAFDMLLALDPTHRLEYTQSPQATFVFQDALADAARRPTPAIDVDWDRDLRVGEPIPVDVEVIADPKTFLVRAALFVRARGDAVWRVADVDLPAPGAYQRILLPPIDAAAATALELHLRAYDREGNEVLAWASPDRPREVPLRWDPPTPWWKRWWVWAVAGTAVAGVTGAVVYAAQWEPSAELPAGVTVSGPDR